ncbi:monoacylglycerol/Diacylglycerol O-acyltransferase isoform X1 [Anolis carolinensis]|nr:PREDICTED: transmembrane protein 68 isoform X1 [Anolis carolinensis]|eukprot:XP_008114386.1 PREDICTED: transmembrane protein 68 isoform X1 [Anolis carolinensis]
MTPGERGGGEARRWRGQSAPRKARRRSLWPSATPLGSIKKLRLLLRPLCRLFRCKQKMNTINIFYSSCQENLTWLMDLLKKWMHPNHYLDYFSDYIILFLGVLTPFVLLFSPVLVVLGCIYLSNVILHIYKRKMNLNGDYLSKMWDNGRRSVASVWDIYGKVWHGYEVHGMDKLPEGPGLVVFYHGAFPLDYYYFVCRLYLQTGRFCRTVVDYHFSKIIGIKLFYDVQGLTHDGRVECVEILKKGYLLGVLPGGAREALFSDENYGLLWGRRTGFAHVARDAKVPVIPIFTKNLREGYRTLGKIWPFKWLYERTRWPIVPVYGGFPVKFCTYIGDPIPYDPNITAEELAEKTKAAMRELRDMHQKVPGSILKALLERFGKHPVD